MKKISSIFFTTFLLISICLAEEPLKKFYISCEGEINGDGILKEKFFQDIRVDYYKQKLGSINPLSIYNLTISKLISLSSMNISFFFFIT